jgi:hypothetical protein
MKNWRHTAALLLFLTAILVFWASFIRPSVVLSDWKVSNDCKSYVNTMMPHYSYHTILPYICFKGDLTVPAGVKDYVVDTSVDGCFMEVVFNGAVVHSNSQCNTNVSHDERSIPVGGYITPGLNRMEVKILFDGGTTRFDVFEDRKYNLLRFTLAIVLLATAFLLLSLNPRYVLFLLLASLVYIHIYPSSFSMNWGYSALEAFPRGVTFVLAFISMALSLPLSLPESHDYLQNRAAGLLKAVRLGLKRLRQKIRFKPACPPALKKEAEFVKTAFVYVILSLASYMVFWFFRTRHSMGDHGYVGQIALLKSSLFFHTSPLAAWVLSAAYRMLKSIGFSYSSYDASAVVACLAGAVSMPALWLICRELFETNGKRIMLFSITASAYFMQMFYGYIEFYPTLLAAMVYYTLAGVYYLKDKASIVWPSIAFAVMFCIHLSSGYLAPSLILLYLYKVYRRSERPVYGFFMMTVPISLIVSLLFTHVIFIDNDCTAGFSSCVKHYISGLKGSDPSFFRPDTFTLTFAQELLTELLYITPGAVVITAFLLAYYLRRTPARDPYFLFLAVSTAGFMLYTVTHSTGTGLPNDWDVLAPVGLPLTLMAGYWLLSSVDDRRLLNYCVASIVIAVLAIHTIPTLLDSADKEYMLSNPSRGFSEIAGYLTGMPDALTAAAPASSGLKVRLLDTVDVGNASSETSHSYNINEQAGNGTANAAYSNGILIEDDYRSFRDYESFIVESRPERELLIVKRVKCPSSQVTRAYLHGFYLGNLNADCNGSKEMWRDIKIEAPASIINGGKVGLMFVSDKKEAVESYYYWFYVKG